MYRRVIRQFQTIGGQVIFTHGIRRGFQLDKAVATVQHFIHDLTGGTGHVRVADQRIGAAHRQIATTDQIHPRIAESPVQQFPHIVATTGVAGVGITHDDDGIAGGMFFDVVGQLQNIRPACAQVSRFGLRLSVHVVYIHIHAFRQSGAGHGKTFRG